MEQGYYSPIEIAVIQRLLDLARQVDHALDDSEEVDSDGFRSHNIAGQDFDDVVEALDALEDLPDDRPGMTLGPAGKAEWALRRLLPNTINDRAGTGPVHEFERQITRQAPCARHCEAKAFKIEIRALERQIADLQREREAVAAAVPERGPILYTAIDALNKVKAWRDCDGNDGFPHEVREQIDAVLMAFETRQKEKPPPPEMKP